jgi:hypothetical protein
MQYALLIYAKPGAAEALGADEQEANHLQYLDIKKLLLKPTLAPATMRKRVPTSRYRPR